MRSDPDGLATKTVLGARDHRSRVGSLSGAWRPPFELALLGLDRLQTIVVVFAVTLILYLPLEPALLSGLSQAAYWILRLLPDVLVTILALAVIVLGDRTARTTPVRVLWAVLAVCMVIVAANLVRGTPAIDSINGLRVVLRYLVLGLLVWWAVDARTSIGPLVIWAVLAAGFVQVVITGAQVLAGSIASASGSIPFDPLTFRLIDGSLGRYDRLGLLMMSVAIAILATGDRIGRGRSALLVSGMILLYLTTSRQGMVGLAIACALLAVFPGVPSRRRGLAFALSALSVMFVLATPGKIAPPPMTEEANGVVPGGPVGTPAPEIGKGSTELSIDANRNFRLFYNLDIALWAATTEPLVGFGPRQHEAENPDPRLAARVEGAGMDWSYARRFTNDSNYASLVIQFGLVAPVLFVMFLLSAMVRAGRTAIRAREDIARFAVMNSAAILVAAFLGPAFEIRTTAIILWVALMAAVAIRPPADT